MWNLFNAKYFRTGRSLLQDLVDIFRNRQAVAKSYSKGFIGVMLIISIGQIVLVNLDGVMFNVAPLTASDWVYIIIATSPIAFVPDIIRTIQNIISTLIFCEYNFALQHFAVKNYKVSVQYVTRLIFAWTMRIYCNFPCTACNHGQFWIVKGEILIGLFTFFVWRICIFDSNS